MADILTQANRLLILGTPLDFDTLLVTNFSASESMSGLFRYEIDMVAEHAKASSVIPDDLVGQKFTVGISITNFYDVAPRRYFNGIVNRFVQRHRDRRFVHYRAELVPWFWLLTLKADCRVFQGKSVPEIVEDLFRENGCTDFRNTTKKSYTKLDYCIQYRESIFSFVSRLFEQEGITYFWEHDDKKHTLVFSDTPSTHKPCPDQPSAVYIQEGGWQEFDNPVTSWEIKSEIRPGKYTARDFHMQMPSSHLEKSEPTKNVLGNNSTLEVYDYPGEYAARFNAKGRKGEVEGEGTKLVKVRMEELETRQRESFGTSLCRGFIPGFNFKLEDHYSKKVNGKYVLTSVQHLAVQTPWYVAEEQSSMGEPYQNSFSCIPDDVPYRPPRITPKPAVQGPQTAIVVGPQGEEIYVDEFGRVKAQFHWDRLGKKDEASSCWMRVSTHWAGKQWGAIHIPRIGHEVVVDFLEGDPDQPLIVGSVYNAEAMPPYALPDNGTQSGIKSRSSKGGSPSNFNEIRFEDKKGSEELHVQAERNLSSLIKASESRSVGGSRTTSIYKDDTITIQEGNEQSTIKKGNREAKIEMGNDTLTLTKGDITIDASMGTYKLTAKNIEVTGLMGIKLSCGAAMIEMKPAMITISAPMVKINS
jgi:type VI secretion system secreted protein VgrG